MPHIDYYFGTGSAWAYLAGTRLEDIAARHGAAITYKPLDLMQLFDRTGGIRPAERHASRKEYRLQELRRWAEFLGMKLNIHPAFSARSTTVRLPHAVNTPLAFTWICWHARLFQPAPVAS